eukprot:CAMPEP_0117460642 /NCGR_PEP_ID=MMETSP0784-20121206/2112_1 /TAXON_ID=39447 /ORGANISM="" /LENGTH=297 /DNA_ID=CAMNT_0005254319 /DNA_START=28 /DNA_END=918 /DNA_ORIENTATION=+
MSGNWQLEGQLEPSTSVSELKRCVAASEVGLSCPTLTQTLLLGTRALGDSELLGGLAADTLGAPLNITMLVSLAAVHENLVSEDACVRDNACEILHNLGQKARSGAIAGVIECIESDGATPSRRARALCALPKLCEKGDRRAVAAAVSSLERCRAAALEVLSQVGGRGDGRAGLAVIRFLGHPSLDVQRGALSALKALALRGHRSIVDAVLAELEKRGRGFRWAAVVALGMVARRGDERALAALLVLLQDPEWQVRHAAVEALRAVADPQHIRDAASGLLQDSDTDVREAARAAVLG